eukprot:TRINITY_DN9715_c0_g1_i1.p1 TRINITY_DN9715_c0_g1~~TRINITY_DN9715_c0_g1_i1.p1  ORF type:complete len:357 (+),score=73.51 TRINITY_DN9715_c0_g1_i1:61-1131(+)
MCGEGAAPGMAAPAAAESVATAAAVDDAADASGARHQTLLPRGCRILAVGEGDFAFSEALAAAKQRDEGSASSLVSTCLEPEVETRAKYAACASGRLENIRAAGARVVCGVDATQLGAEACPLAGSEPFDRILFNFPLLPVTANKPRDGATDHCLANRALLARFLRRAETLLEEREGRVLIASKDLYPYSWWRIEALPLWTGGKLELLQMLPWEFTEYPSLYRGPCNVNRDAAVKSTDGIIFVFGRPGSDFNAADRLAPAFEWRQGGGSGIRLATPSGPFRCEICRLVGLSSLQDLEAHKAGKIHKKRETLEDRWDSEYKHLFEASVSGDCAARTEASNSRGFLSIGKLCARFCAA